MLNRKSITILLIVLLFSLVLIGCNPFSSDEYKINTTVKGRGSIEIEPEKDSYKEGETVEIKAKPDYAGWVFKGWDGSLFESENPKKVVIDGDLTIRADFWEIYWGEFFEIHYPADWTYIKGQEEQVSFFPEDNSDSIIMIFRENMGTEFTDHQLKQSAEKIKEELEKRYDTETSGFRPTSTNLDVDGEIAYEFTVENTIKNTRSIYLIASHLDYLYILVFQDEIDNFTSFYLSGTGGEIRRTLDFFDPWNL